MHPGSPELIAGAQWSPSHHPLGVDDECRVGGRDGQRGEGLRLRGCAERMLALSASSSSPRTFLYFVHPKTTLPSDYHPSYLPFLQENVRCHVLTAHDSLIHGNLLSASEKHSLTTPTEMLMLFIPYHPI